MMTRRGFLQFLAALPGAAALPAFPLVVAEIVKAEPAETLTEKIASAESAALSGPWIEIGGIRVAVAELTVERDIASIIDVTSIYDTMKDYRTGLVSKTIHVRSPDAACFELQQLHYQEEDATIAFFMPHPGAIFTTRGMLTTYRVECPPAELVTHSFDLLLTELVNSTLV